MPKAIHYAEGSRKRGGPAPRKKRVKHETWMAEVRNHLISKGLTPRSGGWRDQRGGFTINTERGEYE